MIDECRFESKILACNASTTTTTSATTITMSPVTTTPSLSTYNSWRTVGIIFIILSVALLVMVVLMICFPQYFDQIRLKVKPRSKTAETISFEEIGEERNW